MISCSSDALVRFAISKPKRLTTYTVAVAFVLRMFDEQ